MSLVGVVVLWLGVVVLRRGSGLGLFYVLFTLIYVFLGSRHDFYAFEGDPFKARRRCHRHVVELTSRHGS